MSKYINPATDFGFKRIFKDEEITRGFLNALLKRYDPKTHIKKVTITDAVGIVNYILGNPSAGFDERAADVNGDGSITITDAVGVVNIILSGSN